MTPFTISFEVLGNDNLDLDELASYFESQLLQAEVDFEEEEVKVTDFQVQFVE